MKTAVQRATQSSRGFERPDREDAQSATRHIRYRFAQAFCSPELRKQVMTRQTLSVSFLASIVDPTSVSENLLTRAGIQFEKDSAGVKVTPELTKRLVRLFSFLKPIPGTDGRWCVVGDNAEFIPLSGHILYFRTVPGRSKKGEVMIFEDLPAALRKTYYQAMMERREDVGSALLPRKVEILRARLQEWRALKPDDRAEVVGESCQLGAASQEALGSRPIAEGKASAAKIIIRIAGAGLKDGIGRLNPRAAATALPWVTKHLERRHRSIRCIEGKNSEDEIALLRTITETERNFIEIRERLAKSIPNKLETLAPFTVKCTETFARAQAANFLTRYGVSLESLQKIQCYPFRTFAKLILALHVEFSDACVAKDKNQAAQALFKLQTVAELACIERDVNLLRFDVASKQGEIGALCTRARACREAVLRLDETPRHIEASLQKMFPGVTAEIPQFTDDIQDRAALERYLAAFNLERALRKFLK
jgi:hypothetical protein